MSISAAVTLYFWLFLVLYFAVAIYAAIDVKKKAKEREDRPGRVLSKFETWPETLLRHGYDGGFHDFIHEPSKRSLKLRKYIYGEGDYGLELWINGQLEMTPVLDKAKELARSLGLAYRTDPLDGASSHSAIVKIDCQRDPASAYKLLCVVAGEAFGFAAQDRYTTKGDRISLSGELIDSPDQSPPDQPPSSQEYMALYHRSTGHSIIAIVVHALVTIVFVSVLFALPTSMILSRGEPPEWSFQFGESRLGGSTESLCFLVLGILFFAANEFRQPRRSKKAKTGPVYLRRLFQIMLFAMPLMTILAWAGY